MGGKGSGRGKGSGSGKDHIWYTQQYKLDCAARLCNALKVKGFIVESRRGHDTIRRKRLSEALNRALERREIRIGKQLPRIESENENMLNKWIRGDGVPSEPYRIALSDVAGADVLDIYPPFREAKSEQANYWEIVEPGVKRAAVGVVPSFLDAVREIVGGTIEFGKRFPRFHPLTDRRVCELYHAAEAVDVPLFDADGHPIMEKDLTRPILDADGQPVPDSDGNPAYADVQASGFDPGQFPELIAALQHPYERTAWADEVIQRAATSDGRRYQVETDDGVHMLGACDFAFIRELQEKCRALILEEMAKRQKALYEAEEKANQYALANRPPEGTELHDGETRFYKTLTAKELNRLDVYKCYTDAALRREEGKP